MTPTNNDSKQLPISKKWLYGSLAVIALLLGLFLDNKSVADETNIAPNTVEQVKINNENGEVEINKSTEDNNSVADDYTEDDDSEE